MLIEYGDNLKKHIKEYPQFGAIHHAKDFMCDCEACEFTGIRRPSGANLISYTLTNEGYMAVFECPKCFDVYRHHIRTIHRSDLSKFKEYATKILSTEIK